MDTVTSVEMATGKRVEGTGWRWAKWGEDEKGDLYNRVIKEIKG